MATRSISETIRIRYLLGLSSPSEREHIEAAYLEDEDAFQEMLTAEDDLIDAYARGELTDEEGQRFEKRFASSLGGRDRVQFARAFASAVSATRPVENKRALTLSAIFTALQSPPLLRTVTTALGIVFVAVPVWLIDDRRRMRNELRELRAESAELSKRTEALQRSSDTERTRANEIAARVATLRAQPNKPNYREGGTIAPQRTPHLPEVKNDREQFEMIKVGPEEQPIKTSDASLGNNLVSQRITQLPLNARNVANLLSLPPAVTPSNQVAGGRSDPINTTLDGIDVTEPVRIRVSQRWIRLKIPLETAAIHEEYRFIIRTADGRLVTSANWVEPLTPNQTIIDTPAISASELPSGDYVLLLEGKERDGSFVQVGDFSFKVIK